MYTQWTILHLLYQTRRKNMSIQGLICIIRTQTIKLHLISFTAWNWEFSSLISLLIWIHLVDENSVVLDQLASCSFSPRKWWALSGALWIFRRCISDVMIWIYTVLQECLEFWEVMHTVWLSGRIWYVIYWTHETIQWYFLLENEKLSIKCFSKQFYVFTIVESLHVG